jgi:hypothetical protein
MAVGCTEAKWELIDAFVAVNGRLPEERVHVSNGVCVRGGGGGGGGEEL